MEIDVQFALNEADIDDTLPQETDFKKWAQAALTGRNEEAQITIRIVNEKEISQLNQQYRHKNGPTNVLSFPTDYPPDVPISLIGDIVICAPVVTKEAAIQKKTCPAHWAHVTVHGTLHLLGYDHENDQDADKMEALEINILDQLGFDNPYC